MLSWLVFCTVWMAKSAGLGLLQEGVPGPPWIWQGRAREIRATSGPPSSFFSRPRPHPGPGCGTERVQGSWGWVTTWRRVPAPRGQGLLLSTSAKAGGLGSGEMPGPRLPEHLARHPPYSVNAPPPPSDPAVVALSLSPSGNTETTALKVKLGLHRDRGATECRSSCGGGSHRPPGGSRRGQHDPVPFEPRRRGSSFSSPPDGWRGEGEGEGREAEALGHAPRGTFALPIFISHHLTTLAPHHPQRIGRYSRRPLHPASLRAIGMSSDPAICDLQGQPQPPEAPAHRPEPHSRQHLVRQDQHPPLMPEPRQAQRSDRGTAGGGGGGAMSSMFIWRAEHLQ